MCFVCGFQEEKMYYKFALLFHDFRLDSLYVKFIKYLVVGFYFKIHSFFSVSEKL